MRMTKSNRDAAGTMGGNVLDMVMVREGVAKLSDNAGPTPTVIESRTYAAGDYPDPEVSRRAERAEPMVMTMPSADPGDACLITIDESRFTRDRFGKRYARESFTLLVGVGAECAKLAVMAGDTEAVVEMWARACAVAHGLPGNARIEWATLEAAVSPMVSPMPAGRWTVSHPDPATKARIEAEMNATGGSFTAQDEVGPFLIGYTPPAHDPKLTVPMFKPGENLNPTPGSENWDTSLINDPHNPAPAAGQVWITERGVPHPSRYTLEREVTCIPERWDTEEGVQILATTLVNQCRYVGTKAECEVRAAEAMRGAKVTAYEYAAAELAKRDLAVYASDAVYLAGEWSPRTWTFTAPPADLRSLHDAIGQAIETGTGRVARFNGGPVVVTRDEMLFSPTVGMDASGGLPATVTIAADTKHLRMLRDAVDEARETGKAPPREWGKGRRVAVERVGEPPTVAAPPSEAEPVRYDGGQGGARAWRWEVGE